MKLSLLNCAEKYRKHDHGQSSYSVHRRLKPERITYEDLLHSHDTTSNNTGSELTLGFTSYQ
jgi:hypothetical protein